VTVIRDLPATPAALLAERDRLEYLLQLSEDWRALQQLEQRGQRGEPLDGLSASQVRGLLHANLSVNPFFVRHAAVVAALRHGSGGWPAMDRPPGHGEDSGSDAGPGAALAETAAALDSPEPAEAGCAEPADDLTRITGIGPYLAARLCADGVTAFAQIRDWTAADIADFAARLDLGGRIAREQWVSQAAELTELPDGPPPVAAVEDVSAQPAVRAGEIGEIAPPLPLVPAQYGQSAGGTERNAGLSRHLTGAAVPAAPPQLSPVTAAFGAPARPPKLPPTVVARVPLPLRPSSYGSAQTVAGLDVPLPLRPGAYGPAGTEPAATPTPHDMGAADAEVLPAARGMELTACGPGAGRSIDTVEGTSTARDDSESVRRDIATHVAHLGEAAVEIRREPSQADGAALPDDTRTDVPPGGAQQAPERAGLPRVRRAALGHAFVEADVSIVRRGEELAARTTAAGAAQPTAGQQGGLGRFFKALIGRGQR
jgi:predicted flap endonuclease-1-like 5' DNA nuclease